MSGGQASIAARESAERNAAERKERDEAVLAVARKHGEVTAASCCELISWRWRNAAKVEGSLRRLDALGVLVSPTRRVERKGGKGVRFYRLPEHA